MNLPFVRNRVKINNQFITYTMVFCQVAKAQEPLALYRLITMENKLLHS